MTVKPVGALRSAASWERERCVFAMQIGSRPRPAASKLRRLLAGRLEQEHVLAAVDARHDRAELLLDRRVVGVREAEVGLLVRRRDHRLGERDRAAPPSSKPPLTSAA